MGFNSRISVSMLEHMQIHLFVALKDSGVGSACSSKMGWLQRWVGLMYGVRLQKGFSSTARLNFFFCLIRDGWAPRSNQYGRVR
jgi:membrane protease subunit (stomatin/prohibitin family)